MVLIDKCYEEMLKEIGFRGYLMQDSICPDRNPNVFDMFACLGEEHAYRSGTFKCGGTATKLMDLTNLEIAMEGKGSTLNLKIMNPN